MNPQLFARGVLWITGGAFFLIGIAYVLAPAAILPSMSLAAVSPAGLSDVRAFYGGGEIGLGLGFLLASRYEPLLRPALWLGVLSLGFMAAGRIFGMLVDSEPNLYLWAMLALEIPGVALNAVGLWLTGVRDR